MEHGGAIPTWLDQACSGFCKNILRVRFIHTLSARQPQGAGLHVGDKIPPEGMVGLLLKHRKIDDRRGAVVIGIMPEVRLCGSHACFSGGDHCQAHGMGLDEPHGLQLSRQAWISRQELPHDLIHDLQALSSR